MSALDELLDECDACYDDGEDAGNHATYAARAELAALRAELDDYRAAAKVAASEDCGDEKHCACVPLLRVKLAEICDIVSCEFAVDQDFAGVKYITLQVDRDTWRELRALCAQPVSNADELTTKGETK